MIGLIQFGLGAVPGLLVILSWQDPNPHPVNAISLGTSNMISSTFTFGPVAGKTCFKANKKYCCFQVAITAELVFGLLNAVLKLGP